MLCNYLLIHWTSWFYHLTVYNHALIHMIFLLGNLMSSDLLKSFARKHYRGAKSTRVCVRERILRDAQILLSKSKVSISSQQG